MNRKSLNVALGEATREQRKEVEKRMRNGWAFEHSTGMDVVLIHEETGQAISIDNRGRAWAARV